MSLRTFGLRADLRERLTRDLDDSQELGRVTSVNRADLEIETDAGPARGELTGRLRFAADDELGLPAVGDWVALRRAGDMVLVTDVLERNTVLKRKRPGDRSEYQLVAANVDVAFIVHGCDLPFNPRRAERYAAMIVDGRARVSIVLNKADLIDAAELATVQEAASRFGPVIPVSAVSAGGIETLTNHLEEGLTYALLGPSGVGKTTLVNGLLGEESFATGRVRKGDRKGRHTTTRRHLVLLPGGSLLIDTPGMRELGLGDMHRGVEGTFAEIADLAAECRYADCGHEGEPGCAVQEAVASGSVSEETLAAYHKLEREAARFERSAFEQRKKDKAQGKLYKRIQSGKQQRR